jgi:multidrug efflux pump subunit AcrA (membrane-fusion protein)
MSEGSDVPTPSTDSNGPPPKLAKDAHGTPAADATTVSVRTTTGGPYELHVSDWQLAKLMDGTRSLETLTRAAKDMGLPATVDQMRELIRQFDAYGLLDKRALPALSDVPWLIPRKDERPPVPEAESALDALPPIEAEGSTAVQPPPPPTVNGSTYAPSIDAATEDPGEDTAPSGSPYREIPPLPHRKVDPAEEDEMGLQATAPRPTIFEPEDAPARRARRSSGKRGRKRLLIGLLFLGGGMVLLFAPSPLRATAPAVVHASKRQQVRSPASGVLSEVRKREGDDVQAGEMLAVVGNTPHAAANGGAEQLRAQLQEAQAALDAMKAGPAKTVPAMSPSELKKAIAARRKKAYAAAMQVKKLRAMVEEDRATEEQLEAAEEELDIRRKELAALTASGGGDSSVAIAPASLSAKQAEVTKLEAKLREMTAGQDARSVKSPIAGVLLTPRFQALSGTNVQAGDVVAEVAQVDVMQLDVLIEEEDVDAVKLGQALLLRVHSHPDQEFKSQVDFIAPQSAWIESLGRNAVRVTGVVKNPSRVLKDGMTGYAQVEARSRPLGVLLWHRLRQWLRVRFVL